jgi:hypothetical protein
MQPVKLTFAGYSSGETDFASMLTHTANDDLATLEDIIAIVAGIIVTPSTPTFVAMTITGHADRDNTQGRGETVRRDNERDSAEARAVSAWTWFQDRVTAAVTAAGADATDWWDNSPRFTGVSGSCGAVWPYHVGSPTDEERAENRRVIMNVSIFNSE